MRQLLAAAGIASVLFWASCGSGTENEQTAVTETQPSGAIQEQVQDEHSGHPGIFSQNDTLASVTLDPGANTQGGIRLNPPHGEPGHVCELPVGAPLNTLSNAVAPADAPAVVPQQPATAPGVKLNPPHGEPGHDCAVAVGAPLPS